MGTTWKHNERRRHKLFFSIFSLVACVISEKWPGGSKFFWIPNLRSYRLHTSLWQKKLHGKLEGESALGLLWLSFKRSSEIRASLAGEEKNIGKKLDREKCVFQHMPKNNQSPEREHIPLESVTDMFKLRTRSWRFHRSHLAQKKWIYRPKRIVKFLARINKL